MSHAAYIASNMDVFKSYTAAGRSLPEHRGGSAKFAAQLGVISVALGVLSFVTPFLAAGLAALWTLFGSVGSH